MADNNDFIPTLTLDPQGDEQSDAAAATMEAKKERDANAVKLDMSQLSEKEQQAVMEFS